MIMRKRVTITLIILNIIFVFISMMIVTRLYNNVYRVLPLQRIALILILIVIYGLKTKRKELHNALLAISCVITVLISVAFIIYLPSFTVNRAFDKLAVDPLLESDYIVHRKGVCLTKKHGNPFAGYGYIFEYKPDGSSIKIYLTLLLRLLFI